MPFPQDARAPKDRTPFKAPNNLPTQPDPLVGREEELQELHRILSEPECRSLSLVGPGGVGKTRLALQLASESITGSPDGVFFVPLVLTRSSLFLASSIAHSLDVSSFGQEDLGKKVLDFLRERQVLLLLDNFEANSGEEGWLSKVLEEAPGVKCIVTAREGLGLLGERVFETHGLKVPPSGEEAGLDQYGSIQLFLAQARKTDPNFQLPAGERSSLVSLCRFLDGMPLGLELAAAWTPALPIRDIFQKIQRHDEALKGAQGHLPERVRGLRAVFRFSWDLLAPPQQELLRKLSVFDQAFRGEAAQAVTGATPGDLDLLCDRAILQRNTGDRFKVHPLLKQYLDERSHEAPALKEGTYDKHCRYYSDRLGKEREWFFDARQKQAIGEMREEIGEIWAAWDHAVDKGLKEEIGNFIEPLFIYCEVNGLFREGERAFGLAARALDERAKKEAPPASHATRVLRGDLMARQGRFIYGMGRNDQALEILRTALTVLQGVASSRQVAFAAVHYCFILYTVKGNHPEARKWLEQSASACEKDGEGYGLAACLQHLGSMDRLLGHYKEAREQLHRSRDLFQQMGDLRSLSAVLAEAANLAFDQSRYEEAEELGVQNLKLKKEIGDRDGEAWTQGNLGNIQLALGNFESAKNLYEHALLMLREMGDQGGIAWALNSVGLAYEALGKYLEALVKHQEGLKIYKKIGNQWGMAWSLSRCGHVEGSLGHFPKAEAALWECLDIFKKIGNSPGVATALDHLGQQSLRTGSFEKAAGQFAEALELYQKNGNLKEVGMVSCHQGQLALAQGDLSQAQKALTLALKTAMTLSVKPQSLQALLQLALLDKRNDRPAQAFGTAYFISQQTSAEWETRDKAMALVVELESKLDPKETDAIREKQKILLLPQLANLYLG